MSRMLPTALLVASASMAAVPNTFSSGKSVVAREVNENFTYLDTTIAKKADANSVTSLQSSLNAKADQTAIASLQSSKSDTADIRKMRDTVRTKVDQVSLANALSPFAKKTYVDSATKATLASAIQANTASIPNIPGSQILGQVNPDNLRNFESGISGADGPNKPWDWAVYQTLAPYAGGSIQLAGRHCSGCGSSYALRTKDDNNASLNWSPWYTLWHSGNLDKNALPYLPIAGGALSGNLASQGSISAATGMTVTGEANFGFDTAGAVDPAPRVAYDAKFRKYGIATTNLLVTGTATIHGNVVSKGIPASNVADYVFEPDYKLTSLSEVEAYTKEHKHLPEVPSATEIGKSGLDLAQMNLVLLKKVEELTLHAIAQEKAISDLKASVQELKNR
ncbi:MAG: hypothetical protein AAB214_20410 [Fibrobacterota bacterium]